MDRSARDLVELTRLSIEDFVRQPAKEDDGANSRTQAEKQRDADELK